MKMTAALLVCALLAGSAAVADDVFPPIWRGEDNTVMAEWDTWAGFNTTPTPILPDTWISTPAGLASGDAQAYDTAAYLTTYESREDVVEINGPAQLDFLLPNYSGEDFTELWVQITYWTADTTDVTFLVDTDPYTEYIGGITMMGTMDHDYGWVTEAWTMTIAPSVDAELVALDFAGAAASPVYVDQVMIESVAAPEPAALSLVLVGAALLRRRR